MTSRLLRWDHNLRRVLSSDLWLDPGVSGLGHWVVFRAGLFCLLGLLVVASLHVICVLRCCSWYESSIPHSTLASRRGISRASLIIYVVNARICIIVLVSFHPGSLRAKLLNRGHFLHLSSTGRRIIINVIGATLVTTWPWLLSTAILLVAVNTVPAIYIVTADVSHLTLIAYHMLSFQFFPCPLDDGTCIVLAEIYAVFFVIGEKSTTVIIVSHCIHLTTHIMLRRCVILSLNDLGLLLDLANPLWCHSSNWQMWQTVWIPTPAYAHVPQTSIVIISLNIDSVWRSKTTSSTWPHWCAISHGNAVTAIDGSDCASFLNDRCGLLTLLIRHVFKFDCLQQEINSRSVLAC